MSEDDRPHTYEQSPGGGSHRATSGGGDPHSRDASARPDRAGRDNGGRQSSRAGEPGPRRNGGAPAEPAGRRERPNGGPPGGASAEYPAYDHYSAQPVYRPPGNDRPPEAGAGSGEPVAYDSGLGGQAPVTTRTARGRAARPPGPPRPPRPPRARRSRRGDGGDRPRVKKLRLLIVLIPLGLLAIVSAFFGAVMSITSDLKSLEKSYIQNSGSTNSKLLALDGEQLGLLTDNTNRVLVTGAEIPREMKWAIVSVEDKRFYTNSGVDLKGIARAFVNDVLHRQAQQGASTITQQFVKNALAAQGKRTIFEKLREAALAYHLTRQWTKDKILTEYLNSIYFGNGAYGIESAARTYFGNDPTTSYFNCGTTGQPLCVTNALSDPANAALIAGVVASPTAFDPVRPPRRGARAPKPRAPRHVRAGVHQLCPVPDGADRGASDRPLRAAAAAEGQRAGCRVLHDLGPPAGHQPVRPGEGLRRRPDGPHDARPAAPGSSSGSGRRLPRESERPVRGARRDRQRDRRGPGDVRGS